MNSILNSISQGDLQVSEQPREIPIKKDSIIDLLQSSEIEFDYFKQKEQELVIQKPELEIVDNITCEEKQVEEDNKPIDVSELLKNSEIKLVIHPILESSVDEFNTGFGGNNDLHYKIPCIIPKIKTPLYQENYFNEFKTEEEKAAARHALGLYNKGDIVAMSLITTDSQSPTTEHIKNIDIKQIKQGDVIFAPITTLQAVFDRNGVSLDVRIQEIDSKINKQDDTIKKITNVSGSEYIESLGDVKEFLQGFNNNTNLNTILDDMNQDMLRFENTGQIFSEI